MPNAIIIGASSGIGRALTRELADDYSLGLAARRMDKLEAVADTVGGAAVAQIDITADTAREQFTDFIDAFGGVDLTVISAGIGRYNPSLDWPPARDTIAVNVTGFAAIATAALSHYEATSGGHLVGISSVAAEIGSPTLPGYSASKAFVGRYLEGLRYRFADTPQITITDIRPGFVDTPMAPDTDRFWECSPETAARHIAAAIDQDAGVRYVTRRWWLVSKFLGLLPDRLRATIM